MSSRSEKESVVSAVELFLDRIRIAEEIGSIHRGGPILTPLGYSSYLVGVSVVIDVEKWTSEGGRQKGWALYPEMESMMVAGKKFLPILQAAYSRKEYEITQFVAFEDLEREDIIPQIGDIAIERRLGVWYGQRIDIFLLQDADIQGLRDDNGSLDSKKFNDFLNNIYF